MPQRSHWLQVAGSTARRSSGRHDKTPQQPAQRAEIAAPEPRPIPVQPQRDEEQRQDRAAAEKRLVRHGEDVVAEDMIQRLGDRGQMPPVYPPTPGSLWKIAVEPSSTAHWMPGNTRGGGVR